MFSAAMVPGMLAALCYMLTIAAYVRLKPGSAGLRERASYAERFNALVSVWPVLIIFARSEEHTSELQSLMRISYAVFCLKKKKYKQTDQTTTIASTIYIYYQQTRS